MKYVVRGVVNISTWTEVEADSKEEAIRLARERPMVSLCDQCGGRSESEECWVTSGELDGSPVKIEVEESP